MAHQRSKSPVCPNCSYRFDQLPEHSNYCPECGQENHDLNVPLKHLFEEFIESVFHFDTKSVRTLRALIFKPGFLTVEFRQGKRVSYVQPVRLYVFISFLFFLFLSISTFATEGAPDPAGAGKKAKGLGITFKGLNSAELKGMSDAALDSVMKAQGVELTSFNRYVVRKLARIGSGGEKEFGHMIVKGISYMMFVLMPFFAFLVWIFNRRQVGNFITMLVYALHYHSYAFLLMVFLSLLGRIPYFSLLFLLTPAVLSVYLYKSLRTVFVQSRTAAVFKTILIGSLHTASVFLLFLAAVFASILLF